MIENAPWAIHGECEQRAAVLMRTSLFSVTDYRCCAGPHSGVAEEVCEPHSIVFLRRGAFVRRIGNVEEFVDPTRALFYNAGQEFAVTHPISEGDDCTILDFGTEFFADAAAHCRLPFDGRHGFRLPSVAATDAMYHLHHLILAESRHRVSHLHLEEAVLDLVTLCLAAQCEKDQGFAACKRDPELVEQVKEFLSRAYQEDVTIERISKNVNWSPFHVCRVFRRFTGQTLHTYLTTLRLRAGLRLLADSTLSASEIAIQLGFCTPSHFTTQFRSRLGVTPKGFRKLIGESGGKVSHMLETLQ